MTRVDLGALHHLAEKAGDGLTPGAWWEQDELIEGAPLPVAIAEYVASLSPDVAVALIEAVEAALRAVTDRTSEIAGAVEHPQTCGLWVELDDVTGLVHPVGECDCGLDALRAALSRFGGPQQEGLPGGPQERPCAGGPGGDGASEEAS